jgi:crotonobetainyl-CoA:carnitine CoA-transferase CaiB-like acyl-CoA transferase
MHLADLGAEVIKIEPPGRGDATRVIGLRAGFSDSFIHRRWNRGKLSLALDTSRSEGKRVLEMLIQKTDILVEGLRPGTLERMGFGWSELTALKPNLVMLAVNGYGQTGPYRDLPSHGPAFDAIAGLAPPDQDELGRPRMSTRHVHGVGIAIGPLFGAMAALAGLSWSRRTGQPLFLDVAQTDGAVFVNLGLEEIATDRNRASVMSPGDMPPSRHGAWRDPVTPQYYRTRDGKVLLLMALERKFFLRLAEAVDRPDLAALYPEDHYWDHLEGNEAIRQALVEAIASKDRDEWMRILGEADVPAVPVNEGAEVLDDPQVGSRLQWLEGENHSVTMLTPVRSDPPISPPQAAPALGGNTVSVLSDLGLSRGEIDELARLGVVAVALGGDGQWEQVEPQ